MNSEMKMHEIVWDKVLSPMCVLEGPDHKFTFANEAYRELIGRRNFINRPVTEVLPEVVKQGFVDLLDKVHSTGEPCYLEEVPVILHKNNKPQKYYLNILYQPLTDENENIYGIFVQVQDITRQVELRKDKVLLLQELDHRVRNNLSIIMGLIDMQAEEMNKEDPLLSIRNIRKRVGTFVKVHELIFRQKDLRNIPVHKLFGKIWDQCRDYDKPGFNLLLAVDELYININQAIPLGLICNEMLSWFKNRITCINEIAIKSTLTDSDSPEVTLMFTISYADKSFLKDKLFWDNRSFEGRLIQLLIMQLKAKLDVKHSTDGTTLNVKFTKANISGSGADYFLSIN